jgi:HEAT repeat protein
MRTKLLAFALCVAAIVGIIFVSVVGNEGMESSLGPIHKGRPAQDWLQDVISSRSGVSQSKAIQAFREMGPDGIVFLVESLEGTNQSSQFYQAFFKNMPPPLQWRILEPVVASRLANAASLVLLNVHNETPEPTVVELVRLLAADNPKTRLHAASVLSHYTSNYPRVNYARHRPDFVLALNDTNDWTRIHIASALLASRLNGPEVTPALQSALTNSNPMIREAAATIRRIEHDAASKEVQAE